MHDDPDTALKRSYLTRIAKTLGVAAEHLLDTTGGPVTECTGGERVEIERAVAALEAAAATTTDPKERRLLTEIAAALTYRPLI